MPWPPGALSWPSLWRWNPGGRPPASNLRPHWRPAGARRCVLLIARLERLARNVHSSPGLMQAGVEFIAADITRHGDAIRPRALGPVHHLPDARHRGNQPFGLAPPADNG